jgi:uncharacterized protein YndB with AHSA1/START domain
MNSNDRKISDQAVKKATSRTWPEWFRSIEKEEKRSGRDRWPHKQIVSYLEDQFSLSPWWCQMVTSAYEKFKGRRELGETAVAGFEIGAQKTVSVSKKMVWDLLIGSQGLRLWLGDTPDLKLIKGQKYRTAEGISGEFRVVEFVDHLRLTWQPADWAHPSTLQLRVISKGESKTTIGFHQEKLPDAAAREQMRGRWKKVLKMLEKHIQKSDASL